jgi:uncharacterized protein YbjT (DUF2867 family)
LRSGNSDAMWAPPSLGKGQIMWHTDDRSRDSTAGARVLVTGATGQQGGRLARLLVQRGHHVRALTRKPDGPAAAALKAAGAEIVRGDLGDQASIEEAAKGVDVGYLVATPYEQGPDAETRWAKTAVNGLHAAGVPYIVYSSVSDADRKTGIPHFDSKAVVEAHLKELRVEHSVVAPVFFMENLLSPWMAAGLAKGVLATGVLPDVKLQVISLPEVAEFTALMVEQRSRFRGQRINIASDELAPPEMARLLSETSGAKVSYSPVPMEQVRQQSEDMARMYDWFNRTGYSVNIPKLKETYPEVHWKTFQQWAAGQDWSKVLAGSAAR